MHFSLIGDTHTPATSFIDTFRHLRISISRCMCEKHCRESIPVWAIFCPAAMLLLLPLKTQFNTSHIQAASSECCYGSCVFPNPCSTSPRFRIRTGNPKTSCLSNKERNSSGGEESPYNSLNVSYTALTTEAC